MKQTIKTNSLGSHDFIYLLQMGETGRNFVRSEILKRKKIDTRFSAYNSFGRTNIILIKQTSYPGNRSGYTNFANVILGAQNTNDVYTVDCISQYDDIQFLVLKLTVVDSVNLEKLQKLIIINLFLDVSSVLQSIYASANKEYQKEEVADLRLRFTGRYKLKK